MIPAKAGILNENLRMKFTKFSLIVLLAIFSVSCANAQEDKIFSLIQKNHLTELSLDCIHYIKFENEPATELSPKSTRYDIRETHNQKCSGDPETSPRLFSITIDEKGRAWSDYDTQVTGEEDKLLKIQP